MIICCFAPSYDTWELFPSEPLHRRRGVCALRGLLGNRENTWSLQTSSQHNTIETVLPLSLTCCTGSSLWSSSCRTPAVLPAASFPRPPPPGWTWRSAPGFRDDWCHRNWAQPKTLKIHSVVYGRTSPKYIFYYFQDISTLDYHKVT